MNYTKIPQPMLKPGCPVCGFAMTASESPRKLKQEREAAEASARYEKEKKARQEKEEKARRAGRMRKKFGKCYATEESDEENKTTLGRPFGKKTTLPVKELTNATEIRDALIVSKIPKPYKYDCPERKEFVNGAEATMTKGKLKRGETFVVAGSATAKQYERGYANPPTVQTEEDADFDEEVERVIRRLREAHTEFSMFAERKCPEGWVNTAKYMPYDPYEVIGKVPITDPYETIFFHRTKDQPSSCPFRIYNPSTGRKLAFKMQVNMPKYFFARPCAGIVLPEEQVHLQIIFRSFDSQPEPVKFKPVFRLMAAFIPRDGKLISETEETVLQLFSDIPKRQRIGAIFKVDFRKSKTELLMAGRSLSDQPTEFALGNSVTAASQGNSDRKESNIPGPSSGCSRPQRGNSKQSGQASGPSHRWSCCESDMSSDESATPLSENVILLERNGSKLKIKKSAEELRELEGLAAIEASFLIERGIYTAVENDEGLLGAWINPEQQNREMDLYSGIAILTVVVAFSVLLALLVNYLS